MGKDDAYAYYLMCRACGDGTIPVGPFDTPAERSEWQTEHTEKTGHNTWLVRDQPHQPGDWD